jgi:hypothetical protein
MPLEAPVTTTTSEEAMGRRYPRVPARHRRPVRVRTPPQPARPPRG